MITAEGVTVRYGRTVALDAADLTASTGITFGLIGPNGSGKSTMLRAMLGALRRTGGRVEVDGVSVDDLTARQRAERIAVVAQEEPSGLPLTAWDSVLLGRSPRLSGWSRYRPIDEEAAADAMVRAGVDTLAHRGIDELSGGERQRVLIARALAQEATHLLLDEPTNHLDVRYQHDILSLVQSLPLTTVVVLHDLNLAARYCDHLMLLDRGRIAARGTPHEVLVPDVLEPVYGISMRRIDLDGVPQLVFRPAERAVT
ncbi:ABC transporter ATP-binding protein [Microbacterium xanthum]|uniref:ABC transporter ATP-binding protein n=1 Tax=Microbacterium xanthum TaxID=3079794 RepID=UPI002AD229DB|nr:ABC transporter ATP-binding protein [Microbacterium sp. KSW-48]MDZ8172217.1 ABC transporter ATP-binding protein [Microbacterium sp. KSW-48]